MKSISVPLPERHARSARGRRLAGSTEGWRLRPDLLSEFLDWNFALAQD